MKRILLAMTAALAAGVAAAKPLENGDVQRLLDAQLGEDVILTVIAQSPERALDVSAEALADLKRRGASDRVLTALVLASGGGGGANPNAGGATGAPAAKGSDGRAGHSRLEAGAIVVETTGGAEEALRFAQAESRVTSRALGFGGAAMYAVLPGASAETVVGPRPRFLFSVPKAMQPGGVYTLASFAVRSNGNREVLVGGGYLSVSVGIHKDRVIPVSFRKAEDQSRAADGEVLYEAVPDRDLPAGQYAWACRLTTKGSDGAFYDFCVR